MGTNLTGAERRAWDLHMQGFCVSAISAVTDMPPERVRDVITGEWLEDKLSARGAKRKRARRC